LFSAEVFVKGCVNEDQAAAFSLLRLARTPLTYVDRLKYQRRGDRGRRK